MARSDRECRSFFPSLELFVPGVPGRANQERRPGGRDFGTCCLMSRLLGLWPSERSVMEHLGAGGARLAPPPANGLPQANAGAGCGWTAEHSADNWRLHGDLPHRLASLSASTQDKPTTYGGRNQREPLAVSRLLWLIVALGTPRVKGSDHTRDTATKDGTHGNAGILLACRRARMLGSGGA
jgi:hypothetical protein